MDNILQKESTSKKKNSFNLPIYLSIFLLSLVVLYLLYSITSKFSFGFDKTKLEETTQRDSLMQIEILNGCGVPGLGETFTTFLRKSGFDVIQTGNYISFEVMNTIIIDRKGNIQNAIAVADSLRAGNSAVIQQINKDYFLDVSVIIGKDYKQLKPLARGLN